MVERIPEHISLPPQYHSEPPKRVLLMTPFLVAIGGLIAFFTGTLIVVALCALTFRPDISYNWVPLSDDAHRGRAVYISNGCWVCHSYYTRPQDNFVGQYYIYPYISQPGDYVSNRESPNLFGTNRQGPDLFNEGGQHTRGWQHAHFDNPRNTTPYSIMPVFSFLSSKDRSYLIAFLDQTGGKEGILRAITQAIGSRLHAINGGSLEPEKAFPDLVKELKEKKDKDYKPDGKPDDASPSGLSWKHVWSVVGFERGYWLTPDPLPVTKENLARGKAIYLERCTGCHGEKGMGHGPAARYLSPKPFDFFGPEARAPGASDGDFYYRILTAGKGTSMENFGTRLSVEGIWRTVLFLRTVDHGTLTEKTSVPTAKDYVPWTPPPLLLKYIESHPIDKGPGVIRGTEHPFLAAAHWLASGMAADDMVLVGGKLPITQARLAALIEKEFQKRIRKAYRDAVAARVLMAQVKEKELPPLEKIEDTRHMVFHGP